MWLNSDHWSLVCMSSFIPSSDRLLYPQVISIIDQPSSLCPLDFAALWVFRYGQTERKSLCCPNPLCQAVRLDCPSISLIIEPERWVLRSVMFTVSLPATSFFVLTPFDVFTRMRPTRTDLTLYSNSCPIPSPVAPVLLISFALDLQMCESHLSISDSLSFLIPLI